MEQLPTLSSQARVLEIVAGQSRYEAVVGSGLLATIGERAAKLFRAQRCAVICDTTTGPLFAKRVTVSLESSGFEPLLITVPAGENSKSLPQAGAVCDQMQEHGLDRSSFVIALGGGVIGDLAGFAAAIYHRGIPCVQAPTTLLAQVDSAIGGKSGVNTIAGKNLLGAIQQPALVIADTDTLSALPAREFRQGFAEIVKHAIIADASLLDARMDDLQGLVARNVAIKARIVASDENDLSGGRAILNFGHTIGHAIEHAAGYGTMLHGEAISLGTVAACEISVQRAGLPAEEKKQVIATLQKFELPTRLASDFPRAKILAGMKADKKFERGQIRFVVSPRLGSARLTSDVTLTDIEQAIAEL